VNHTETKLVEKNQSMDYFWVVSLSRRSVYHHTKVQTM
jgi:hypothetical protein